ncbi:response regulator [Sulfurovum sp.]|uniref:response regulator n=1 Tax=Sulfurovum sp. TaxID=1969726 RepID=UPI0028682659|nr:response regulator [Sulfurovum sp.]
MHKLTVIFIALFCSMLAAEGSFIVLTKGEDQKSILQKQDDYERLVQKDVTLRALMQDEKFESAISKIDKTYILKVGPFKNSDALAMVYLSVQPSFDQAFIMESKTETFKVEPIIQTVEKIVYVDKKEKVDNSLWFALFALAMIGIVYMFLSSEQIRRLKREHQRMRSKHLELELKQHEALSSMGENIEIIAKETMIHTHQLAEKVKETPFYTDVEKVMYNENELLDVTGDLVKFLRLKSKKVVIQNEIFNFNHVLNEVAGLLNTKYKQNDTELIFDIDKQVPRHMYADSENMGQILINLLEYFIQNSRNKEVKLEVIATADSQDVLQLKFQIAADVKIKDKETLFHSYYDEEAGRYIGLGLFVAKELTYLMNGELEIIDNGKQASYLIFTLPVEEKEKEKRKYRLPNKSLVAKKILIVDQSDNAALAIEKLFVYFKADVTVLSEEDFKKNMPNFALYEIVALSNVLFDPIVLSALGKAKKTEDIKIISLDNLFTSHKMIFNDEIDISLKKPLTQEYVFDTLVELYDKEWAQRAMLRYSKDREASLLPVYGEMFEDTKHVTLESFSDFKDAHILIVEDNMMNQKAILDILGKSKMKLSVANNGQEAIEFLSTAQKRINIVLMDINMPVMDGYRAAEIMRKSHRFDQTAIIFLTALASEHEVEKMLDSGMNGFLSKPVKIETLYTALTLFVGNENLPVSKRSTSKILPPVFDGLDVQEGLSHVGDNIIFYKQVLQEFVDAYAQSDKTFERLVEEERYGQIKILCMDMKGVTSTIGAKEMYLVLNEVHQYLIYKKPELIRSYVERYKTELARLIASIEMYLSI